MNLAFFASGGGSNMQSIIDACKSGDIDAVPAVVITNNSKCGAVERAETEGIAHYHLSTKTHPDPAELDTAMLDVLKKHDTDLVILAGYMKKISPAIVKAYSGRILNIHPGLLPKHGGDGMYGINVHTAVIAAGDKESGASVHLVDEEYDRGEVLGQIKVPVLEGDTPEILSARVLEKEHVIFPDTIKRIASGEIKLG
jgi:phosphoribosylglycinamide formyltransferase-1